MPVATIHSSGRLVCYALAMLVAFSSGAQAFEGIEFVVVGNDVDLTDTLRSASVLLAAEKTDQGDAQDLFANARAEYASLLNALYAAGHYGPVIHVYTDGREAADIAPLDAPTQINRIKVVVDPGPRFAFSQAQLQPLPKGIALPAEFARGQPAESGVVLGAVSAGVDGWRARGHAKARVASQDVVADHPSATLSADIALDPGPRLRFGHLEIKGNERMRTNRIRKIAGLPEGEVYDPAEVERAKSRLRRTGVFKSVTLEEDEFITPPDFLGTTATVVEQKPRRYTLGAEVASTDGLTLTGGWIHRNLAGGGERLELGGEVSSIGMGAKTIDYGFTVSLDRPATFTPDTTLGFDLEYARQNDPDYTGDLFSVATSLNHVFSDQLSGRAGLGYDFAKLAIDNDEYIYRYLSLPSGLTWDRRDNKADARRGFYIDAEVKPFLGFGYADSGLRTKLDLRGYKALGEDKQIVMAARVQVGAILGASPVGAPWDELFQSGGGGTVRGQPYQSLTIDVLRDDGSVATLGGTQFLATSIEARVKTTDKIGIVGFLDIGRLDVDGFFADSGKWHAGTGLGVRYATGVGPIRLDVAAPVGGKTGDGVQVYVGIGQSF